MLSWLAAAALLILPGQALDKIVVTTAPPLDTERLSDALRVYLGEFGIRIESATVDEADDLGERITNARRLGERVRAVAVIRAARGTPGEVEIELIDLATQKTLLATIPKPLRDEDLYRTLALKVQSILRATLSEARGSVDPNSAVGRLVSEPAQAVPPPPPVHAKEGAPGPLTLEAGYDALSLTSAGVVFQGLSVTATYSLPRWLEVSLGTAAFGSVHVSSNGVDAFANIIPIRAAARARLRRSRIALSLGPALEVGFVSVAAVSAALPVHSARDTILALGGEGEARFLIAGPAWGYLRAAALGALDGPSYDVGGVPILDTSRLQLSAGAGVGLNFNIP